MALPPKTAKPADGEWDATADPFAFEASEDGIPSLNSLLGSQVITTNHTKLKKFAKALMQYANEAGCTENGGHKWFKIGDVSVFCYHDTVG